MNSENFDLARMVSADYPGFSEKASDKFNRLASLDLSDKTESKNGLSYVSWANAWKAFKEVYPTANYKVRNNPQTGLPYFVDPEVGIMVFTEVEADGLQYSMWLPVLDSSQKSMRTVPYTYQVWDKYKKEYVEKTVEAVTIFDINRSIMRCLVKNLAMFGLALYIYAGEDLPDSVDTVPVETPIPQTKTAKSRKSSTDRYELIRQAINATGTPQELMALYQQHENEVKGNPQILALFTQRKEQLLKSA